MKIHAAPSFFGISSLLLLSTLIHLPAPVQSLTEDEIKDVIRDLQSGLDYLDQIALQTIDSYQTLAMENAANFLSGSTDYDNDHIRNSYAAGCMYYATYEQSNSVLDDSTLAWTEDANWITNPDYCTWFGLTCENNNIISIELFGNNLSGSWPAEVGLLGDHLVLIDLEDNEYLYANNYDWFQSMSALKTLWFGISSWDADGIPTVLNQLTSLERFDCHFTFWSDGPIHAEAFENLDNLAKIGMGINQYKTTPGEEIPSTLLNLPSLTELKFDNVDFVDVNTNEDYLPSLNFLSDMGTVQFIEFDYTEFSGGIPELPDSLTDFSCIFCNLSGNIDNLTTSEAGLSTIYLSGNFLTGAIPAIAMQEANPGITIFQVEGNDLWETTIPEYMCTRADAFNMDDDEENDITIGADVNVCENSCCTCVSSDCGWEVDDPLSPAPTEAPAPVVGGFCFSGSNTVHVQGSGLVKMADLSIGDKVMVRNDYDKLYESIYSFGHKEDNVSTEYLRITTAGKLSPLEISSAHMVATKEGRMVPASTIRIGDELQTGTAGNTAIVKNIRVVTRQGAYAPFTASGKIIVNDILASNYIAYEESEYLSIGTEVQTPFTYQWIAHTFNSFHRLVMLLGKSGIISEKNNETYTPSGVSHWVDMPHRAFSWVLQQNSVVASVLIFTSLLFFASVSILEKVLLFVLNNNSFFLFMIAIGGAIVLKLNTSFRKKIHGGNN